MNRNTKKMRTTKKDIYAAFGIEYRAKDGKILSPVFGWIKPLLKHGNTKIGLVWQLSMLPREISYTFTVNGKEHTVCGTCLSTCRDKDGKITCYACAGHFQRHTVRASLGVNTWFARYALDFMRRAIMAQIAADKIEICRVHVAGDFFSIEYAEMWKGIAESYPAVCFWTYTKNAAAERIFDGVENFHVVKSVIPGKGFNYGHCDYIIALYDYLTKSGKSVYICLCGFDDSTHCDSCGACRTCDFVLFLEHSTDYKAKEDPLYPVLYKIAMSQKRIVA